MVSKKELESICILFMYILVGTLLGLITTVLVKSPISYILYGIIILKVFEILKKGNSNESI